MAKAVDTVSFVNFNNTLRLISIDGSGIDWIPHFVCYRTQRVKVELGMPASRSVLSGKPQGTVLGLQFYHLYR